MNFHRHFLLLPIALLVLTSARSSDAISCPDNFDAVGEGCFLHLRLHSTWETARSRCSELGGRLAILDECELFHNVVQYIRFNGWADDHCWIGATDLGVEGDWIWLDGSPMAMGTPFWGSQSGIPEPTGSTTQNCATMLHTDALYFHDYDCDEEIYSLCQADPLSEEYTELKDAERKDVEVYSSSPITCPGSYSLVGEGCFMYLDHRVSWDEARTRCSDFGGKLAILDQCDLFADVVKFIQFNGWDDEDCWIGATDQGTEGDWYWLDGSPVAMGTPFWGSDELIATTLHCAYLRSDNRLYFADGSCSALTHALCQADPLSQEVTEA